MPYLRQPPAKPAVPVLLSSGLALRKLNPMTPIDELTRELRRLRNADGGWGYYAAKVSRLEPTAWALLAWPTPKAAFLATGHPRRIAARAGRRGAKLRVSRSGNDCHPGTGAPTSVRKRFIAFCNPAREGSRLGGQPSSTDKTMRCRVVLAPNSFSWVKPTAWCLFALKLWAPTGGVDSSRIDEAEALLTDRCCLNGGWNYGNANMLGKELAPHVPPTAVALLALQDRAFAAVRKSLAYLEFEAISERSSYALSLALLSLRAHRRSTDPIRAAAHRAAPSYDGAESNAGNRDRACPRSKRKMHKAHSKSDSAGDPVSRRDFLGTLALPLLASACGQTRPYDGRLFNVPTRSAVALFGVPGYQADFADVITRGLRELSVDVRACGCS